MCNHLNCLLECKDWIIILIGFGLSVGWAIFIFCLRPKISINLPEISNKTRLNIVIPVENKSLFFSANKITIEASAIDGNFTYHFDIDFKDFVLIPTRCKGDSVRKFKSYNLNSNTAEIYGETFEQIIEKLKTQNIILRIRVHACHELTGLGKSYESRFEYKNNSFNKIK